MANRDIDDLPFLLGVEYTLRDSEWHSTIVCSQ